MNIDWQSERSHLILNPRLPAQEKLMWEGESSLTNEFSGHIWLSTSGSQQTKLVALHKKAILASAQAVNEHLQTTASDRWINPLPLFHVGGLGIEARAHLKGAAVYAFSEKWSPQNFHQLITNKQGTLTALVPAQVYDLVIHKLTAPKGLRAVIVGGGALQESLYMQARELGWPLLPSYGLTECASQVATATLDSLLGSKFPELEILSHIQIKTDGMGTIRICSPSLLTAYAIHNQKKIKVVNPLVEGWFFTEDRGFLSGKTLKFSGRWGDFIKIGGESVELGRLEKILEEIKLQQKISFDVVLSAVPDSRLGHVIHLFSTDEKIKHLQAEYDQRVMPFERIRQVHIVSVIPRSPLNKVLKNELINTRDVWLKS